MLKNLLKKLLNTRVGAILVLEAFLIILERINKTGNYQYFDAYSKLINEVTNELNELKKGSPFTGIFENPKSK